MGSRKKYALLVTAAVAVPVGATFGLAGTGNAAPVAPGHVLTSESGVIYQGSAAANHVQVFPHNGMVRISDTAGITAGGACRLVEGEENLAECPAVPALKVQLGEGADVFTNRWRTSGTVDGGGGADTFHAGVVDGVSSLSYAGGLGFDTISYAQATSGVVVTLSSSSLPSDGTPSDGTPSDGRAGDADRVRGDIEQVVGSAFDDDLTANGFANWLDGGPGRDRIRGGAGSDTLTARDLESDLSVNCGKGVDRVIVDAVDPASLGCEVIERP